MRWSLVSSPLALQAWWRVPATPLATSTAETVPAATRLKARRAQHEVVRRVAGDVVALIQIESEQHDRSFLSRAYAEPARVAYLLRKPRRNGATHLVMTPMQFLARLAS